MDWTTLLTSILGALIGSGIVTAIIERRYQNRLDERLERIKDQLTRDAYSYQVRFSRLYALRVALVRRLYRLFALADRAARRLLDRYQPIGTGLPEATGALRDFWHFVEENQWVLPDELVCECEQTREVLVDLHRKVADAMSVPNGTPPSPLDYRQAEDIVTSAVRPTRRRIEAMLRQLVETANPHSLQSANG